jgi:hypothetical protein
MVVVILEPLSRKPSIAVTHYRVFLVDQRRHPLAPPTIIECADDQAAIAYARRIADGRAVEVWEQGRFVALITIEGRVL